MSSLNVIESTENYDDYKENSSFPGSHVYELNYGKIESQITFMAL